MKKITFLALFSVLIYGNAFADEIRLPNVTVYGTAVTEVTPDKMIWRLQVLNKDQTLEIVAAGHLEILKDVTAYLRQNGIKEEDLQTSRMEFGENWEYRNRSRVKEGYYARSTVTFTMTDFDKYEKIWGGLSRIRDVSMNHVSYDHTQRIRLQNETRVRALLEAKDKARILAETVGSMIAEPLLIEEMGWSDDVRKRMPALQQTDAFAGGERQAAISPGQIEIRMRIKAVFRLITNNP